MFGWYVGKSTEITSLSTVPVSGVKTAGTISGLSKEQENLSAGVKRGGRKPFGQGIEYRYSGIGAD
jgi:hypothetical protein